MVPGVADVWGRDADEAAAKRLVSPEQLRAQLAALRECRAVVVLLVDLLDASGSFLSRVRDLVGKNPVILVGTKVRLCVLCHRMRSSAPTPAVSNNADGDLTRTVALASTCSPKLLILRISPGILLVGCPQIALQLCAVYKAPSDSCVMAFWVHSEKP
jgi:hypothetical protein